MRRSLALIALAASTFAQSVAPPAIAAPWQLERSNVFTVKAPDGHDYRVMVAWPEGAPPPNGWPVLWLLDGEDNFAVAAMTARRLARASARSGVEAGLVVAIDSGPLKRRVLDYTPAVPGYSIPAGAPASGLPTGGAETFLAFLDQSVRPIVQSRWAIDPRRQTLMGHSFGGLLALHALAKGGSWTNYVAVSPSLWFGGGLLTRELADVSAKAGVHVLIASGDREAGPVSGTPPIESLANRLSKRGVDARALILPGQSHGSTMMAAMQEGIMMAFGGKAK